MATLIYLSQTGYVENPQLPIICNHLPEAKEHILNTLKTNPKVDFEDLQSELNRLDDTPDFEDVKVVFDSGDWYKITPIKGNPYEAFIVKAKGVFMNLGITPESDLENLKPDDYEQLSNLLNDFIQLEKRMKYLAGDNYAFLWWHTYKDSEYEFVLRYFF